MTHVIFWFLISFLVGIRSTNCEYQCYMSTSKISCTNIQHDAASNGIKVTLDNEDVGYLNISNSNLTHITKATFGGFPFLHTLYITNGRVKSVEVGAFWNNMNLREVHLVNNFLVDINSSVFADENSITILDLSHNYLEDLSAFNLSRFPQLSRLNLTNNRLQYLPVSIIEKLREKNDIYIIIDNNPFDCEHPEWSTYLIPELIDMFCTNKTYIYNVFPDKPVFENENLRDIIIDNIMENNDSQKCPENNPGNDKVVICSVACSFNYCVAWFAGGVWLGIIVGNIFKIKGLLCRNNLNRTADKNTQYDAADYSLKLLPRLTNLSASA